MDLSYIEKDGPFQKKGLTSLRSVFLFDGKSQHQIGLTFPISKRIDLTSFGLPF